MCRDMVELSRTAEIAAFLSFRLNAPKLKLRSMDFFGCPVVKNLPANTGDTGWIPVQETRTCRGDLSPWATTTEAVLHRRRHSTETPAHLSKEQHPLPAAREIPRTMSKTLVQPKINSLIWKNFSPIESIAFSLFQTPLTYGKQRNIIRDWMREILALRSRGSITWLGKKVLGEEVSCLIKFVPRVNLNVYRLTAVRAA